MCYLIMFELCVAGKNTLYYVLFMFLCNKNWFNILLYFILLYSVLLNQVYTTIRFLNTKWVYHLDIKVENLMIKKTNKDIDVKIIDFGQSYLENNVSYALLLHWK